MPTASSAESGLNWISSAILGSIGTVIAVLAIAGVGLASLQGRIAVRRGAITVIGCFILFSSRSIATALVGVSTPPVEHLVAPSVVTPAYTAPSPPPVPYDPYSGASVPERPQDRAGGLRLR